MKNTDVLTLIHSKEKVSFYTGKSNNPMSFFQKHWQSMNVYLRGIGTLFYVPFLFIKLCLGATKNFIAKKAYQSQKQRSSHA